MALLWMDGFKQYAQTAGVLLAGRAEGAYDAIYSNAQVYQNSGSSLFGFIPSTGVTTDFAGLIKNLPAAVTTGTLGIGAYLEFNSGIGAGDYDPRPFSFFSSANVDVFSVSFDRISGQILAYQGGTVRGNSGAFTVAKGVPFHIEVKLVSAPAGAGTMEIRINGVTRVSVTGLSNTTPITSMGLWTRSGFYISSLNVMGHLYIWNGSGTENNDWFGERNVYTLFPNADTAQADWTLSTGTSGYPLVGTSPSTPSTKYIQGSTVGLESAFDIDPLPSTDILIKGIQVMLQGSKTGTSDNQLEYGLNDGTVKTASPNTPLSQNVPLYSSFITETNPATGLAWQPGELDNILVYAKRTV